MITRWIAVLFLVCTSASVATAQQSGAYIQVEARNTIEGARDSARQFAQQLPNIGSFALPGGWYGIAVGPFADTDVAQDALVTLRLRGVAPPDAYVQSGLAYGERIWPEAGDVSPDEAAQQAQLSSQSSQQQQPVAQQQPEVPTETVSEARASERALTRSEREELQIAMRWGGYYSAAIDGAFGQGTRRAMGAWQSDNGFEATGVLTTRQRATLMAQYNAVFDGLGMARYAAQDLGISVELPMGVIERSQTEPPFAIFEPTSDLGARVLLISQQGGQDALTGLYEVMQTLEIVPPEGARQRDRLGFVLTGENNRFVSHTEVSLENGQIKGFTLIWPAGDEARRSRLVTRISQSFERNGAVLRRDAVPTARPGDELVAGLRVRQPLRTGAGFFVDNRGTLVTSNALVNGCGQVTLGGDFRATPMASDAALGAAVLRVEQGVAPRGVAEFRSGNPSLRSEVAVAGYPFGGVLGAASLTFGTYEDGAGLNGEAGLSRLSLAVQPGDAGGPVLDAGGSVVGMLLPVDKASGRQLPEKVQFAAGGDALVEMLRGTGVAPRTRSGVAEMAPEDLTVLAGDMTVLVECWE